MSLRKPTVIVQRHLNAPPFGYLDLDALQRKAAEKARADLGGTLILAEISPTITLGRRTPPGDLLLSKELLKKKGIEVLPTNRGGLATYHGPGQWVVYVVDRLENLVGDSRGVRKVVHALLGCALKVAQVYCPQAEIRSKDQLGVWGARGKLVSLGIQIEKGVLLHGLAINGYRTSQSFLGIRPCGLEAPIDFLLPTDSDKSEKKFTDLGLRIQKEFLHYFWRD